MLWAAWSLPTRPSATHPTSVAVACGRTPALPIASPVSTAPSGDATTLDVLAEKYEFSEGCLDFVFFDHWKDVYLDDLQRLVDRGLLQPGTIVVADNVGFPGAPKYRTYMKEQNKASGGKPSSTTPRSSIRRHSKIWFWSQSSWAEPHHHYGSARKTIDPML